MTLQYEILLPEFVEMAWVRHRSSIRWLVGIGVGLIGLILGIAFVIYADRWMGVFVAAMSAFLLLMQFVIPTFVFRRVYRRNGRMFGPRTVMVNENGVSSDHQLGHSDAGWSTYQKFQETGRSFLLYQSADIIGILPKRAFASPADIEEFKRLLISKLTPS